MPQDMVSLKLEMFSQYLKPKKKVLRKPSTFLLGFLLVNTEKRVVDSFRCADMFNVDTSSSM
jgi:hypothetical protein